MAQSIGIWTIGAVFVVITIVAFSWVVRAMLGVQFSWTRLTVAGLISYFCFTPIMNGIVEPGEFEDGRIFPEFWFILLGVMLALICGMVGVPPEGIGLILGVDRFLDMCRTTLNVTGDLMLATVVSRDAVEPRTA